jgi:uncharacterized membrane protein
MLRGIINFILENFVHPLFGNSVQLNPLNTVLYSAMLAGIAVIIVSKIKESGFSVDRRFFLSSTPLMVLTGFILGLSSTSASLWILKSPYSFIMAGSIAAAILATSFEISKRDIANLHSIVFILPLPGILLLFLISTPKAPALLTLASIVSVWNLVGYAVLRTLTSELMKIEFVYPIFAHYLDASTSFIAISSGAREKMYLGSFFVEQFGSGGIFVLKTLVIVPLTYYIFRNVDGEEKIYLLYLITALGIVLSARNLLSGF